MLHLELTRTSVRYICEEKIDGAKLPSCMMVDQSEFGHVTWRANARDRHARLLFVCDEVMSASEDEFDYFPDSFAAGIDWDSVPGLSSVPVPSQSCLPTVGRTPAVEQRPSTPQDSAEHPDLSSSQYSFDEVDDAFLAEIDKAEQKLLQSQVTGPSVDRGEGASTHSIDGIELMSRFFYGEHILCATSCN